MSEGRGASVDLERDVSLMLKNDVDEVAKEQAHWDAVEADRKKQAQLSGQTYTHVNWGSRWDLLRQEDQIIAWNGLAADHSLGVIGRRMGVSRQRVFQILVRLVRVLRARADSSPEGRPEWTS